MAASSARRAASNGNNLTGKNWKIDELPGLSQEDCDRLHTLSVHSTFDLLSRTQTPQQKQAIATELKIHLQHVLRWAALADLARVPEVGCQYCGLVLHAGVSSPLQLAQTPLPRLHRQILKLHVATMQRQDLCPDLSEVASWIRGARTLVGRAIGQAR